MLLNGSTFTSVHDVANLSALIEEGLRVKAAPLAWSNIGRHKTLGLIFFNPSLRTRLSSQRAAWNLGMNTLVVNVGTESWKIEMRDGVVMDGETVEHIKEGAAVIGAYTDILGVRAFATLTDKHADIGENVLSKVQQYACKPLVSLESALRHPLQSFADILTIEEVRREQRMKHRPKVVLTWAPHPKALPQAVANSFAEWMLRADVDLVITHPEGYALDEAFTQGAYITQCQDEALECADFVYAKNWSAFQGNDYGKVLLYDTSWTITAEKMRRTRNGKFMHCLPTRRNVEVADDVLDSSASLVIRQAENRVVAMQTVLKCILENL
ncbi:MAG: acetylornithine carbamoyltransferase [Bacteroidota bacterium]|nr:acetylornithine carbamoyltransferase [Candidatus Kapabacteria bacterium]MDW8220072.1 acetylornithine carbamoyltransferase [Bacteroidota bacterium]